ncbi:MAG TPA: hypothetical protein VHO29_04125 [Marmoricola sp.]|nr:hypothetical protein [Marmoricola sp.]
MTTPHRGIADPQWELTLEIAGKLWLYAEHAVEIDATPAQRSVDVQWAAYQAGRLIGVRTRVDISAANPDGSRLCVRITYVDPDGQGLVRAQDGLDSLVQAVRRQQLAESRLSGSPSSPPPSSAS